MISDEVVVGSLVPGAVDNRIIQGTVAVRCFEGCPVIFERNFVPDFLDDGHCLLHVSGSCGEAMKIASMRSEISVPPVFQRLAKLGVGAEWFVVPHVTADNLFQCRPSLRAAEGCQTIRHTGEERRRSSCGPAGKNVAVNMC